MRQFRPIHLLLALSLCAAPSLIAQNSGAPFKFGFGLSGEASQNAPSQAAVSVNLGHSVVALTGPWKFHIGDNPQWSAPNFDDSQWETVSLTAKQSSIDPILGFKGFVPGWTAKGYPGYSGSAWYRIRVRITGADEPLAILTPNVVDDAFQLFVNGRFVGEFGDFRHATGYYDRARRFILPADALRLSATSPDDQSAVIAFRFYMVPRTLLQPMAGGFHAPPAIGYADSIEAAYHVAMEDLFRATSPSFIFAIWSLVFAVLVLMLYLFDRTETVLFWPLAAALLDCAITGSYAIASTTEWMTVLPQAIFVAGIDPLAIGLWLMTFRAYFHLDDRKWLRNLIGIVVLWGTISAIPFQIVLLSGHVSRSAFLAYFVNNDLRSIVLLALVGWIGWLGRHRARRGNWALFLALLLLACGFATAFLRGLHLPSGIFLFGVHFVFFGLFMMAMMIFLAIAFLQRFRISQRRQQAMEEDVKQAQQVQQMLVPENLPRTPGLTIESEYRPAREVGGDFFQILSNNADASVLIVAGDVTGKGLQAGMLVALIVGAVRTAARYDPDPMAVLNELNQRLCGRGHAHATCLAMRIAADGAVALANAGHLPPYLNGRELPMEGALPLGMVENAEFSIQNFQLAPGATLMLMSDGVVESQDAQGKLFGFDRIHALLQKPTTAAEVAAAAQAFGQQDDISVLRIMREAAPEGSTVLQPILANS